MKKVSVIIPNYNNAAYLGACLDSVRAQTYDNLEIIVIDDASADDSAAIARKAAAADPRVAVHIMPANGGVGAARNFGMSSATGDFIVFLDSDDLLAHTAVEAMTAVQSACDCDVVVGAYAKVPDGFYIPPDARFAPPSFAFDYWAPCAEFAKNIEHLNLSVVWGKLIRRRLLAGMSFRTDVFPCEDVEFVLRLYARVESGAILKERTNYYRSSATSIIAKRERDNSADYIKVLKSLAEFAADPANGHPHYLTFMRYFAYTFARSWATKTYALMRPRATLDWTDWDGSSRLGDWGGARRVGAGRKRDLRRRMIAVSAAMRGLLFGGAFRGIRIPAREWVAIWLFCFGFVETAAKMFSSRHSTPFRDTPIDR